MQWSRPSSVVLNRIAHKEERKKKKLTSVHSHIFSSVRGKLAVNPLKSFDGFIVIEIRWEARHVPCVDELSLRHRRVHVEKHSKITQNHSRNKIKFSSKENQCLSRRFIWFQFQLLIFSVRMISADISVCVSSLSLSLLARWLRHPLASRCASPDRSAVNSTSLSLKGNITFNYVQFLHSQHKKNNKKRKKKENTLIIYEKF